MCACVFGCVGRKGERDNRIDCCFVVRVCAVRSSVRSLLEREPVSG